MRKEIDFLKAYEKKNEQGKNIIRFLSGGLILIIVVYCIFLIGVFVYWQVLNKNLKEINNKVELKKTQIKQSQKKESLYFVLKEQLSSLSKLISEAEVNHSQILFPLFQIAENKVKLSEIKISSEGESMISVVAPNAFSLATFLEEITKSKDLERFSKITLSSLSRQKEGNYIFSMTFSYK